MIDENGLYDPREIDDEADDDAPAPSPGAYRVRSETTWDLAREAYLGGETAESVCARFDLGLSGFWDRARKGGWRRCDRADPLPLPVDAGDDIDFDAGYAELADHALRQMRRAMARGRASAAVSWMRLHERLGAQAEREARETRVAEARARMRTRTRVDDARPDAIDAVSDAALSIEAIARRLTVGGPLDGAGRAAIEVELARLDADLRRAGSGQSGTGPETASGTGTEPDEPDTPDAVFTGPPP